jgi:hypothetical protein
MRSLSGRVKGRIYSQIVAVGATLAVFGLAGSAQAGFTSIASPPLGGTLTQPQILDHLYGGTFTLQPDGEDYSNGTISALRVADYLPATGATAANPGPAADDQIWSNSGTLTATAVYSGAQVPSSPFGYIPGSSGGAFTSLFAVGGSTFSVTGSASLSLNGNFRIAAQNPFGLMSSLASDNTDPADPLQATSDHEITYQITGLGGTQDNWLAFFNDYGNTGNDQYLEYDNLVINLKTTPTASSPVPEPTGIALLFGGLGLGLLLRFRGRTTPASA